MEMNEWMAVVQSAADDMIDFQLMATFINEIIAVLAVASVKIHCDYSILACLGLECY